MDPYDDFNEIQLLRWYERELERSLKDRESQGTTQGPHEPLAEKLEKIRAACRNQKFSVARPPPHLCEYAGDERS